MYSGPAPLAASVNVNLYPPAMIGWLGTNWPISGNWNDRLQGGPAPVNRDLLYLDQDGQHVPFTTRYSPQHSESKSIGEY